MTLETGYVVSTSAKGKIFLQAACRLCKMHRNAALYRLRKLHPQPPAGTPCECCGRVGRLHLDHDHKTDLFRGWLCHACNVSIGMLGDDAKGVRKALAYLGDSYAPSCGSLDLWSRACVECGTTLTLETSYVQRTNAKGKVNLNSTCRPCHIHLNAAVRRLHKLHTRPPAGTPCECCGRIRRLCLDHDHKTDEFRGWLCHACNVSIGGLGDNPEGVTKALTYLGG
jgi:hypothetical protein